LLCSTLFTLYPAFFRAVFSGLWRSCPVFLIIPPHILK
jgi:hypothetical protein